MIESFTQVALRSHNVDKQSFTQVTLCSYNVGKLQVRLYVHVRIHM